MEKEKLIVIQSECLMNRQDFQILKKDILQQRETGVIILPPWCKAVLVEDDDVEVRVEQVGTV